MRFLIAVLCFSLYARLLAADADVLIADFEGKDYGTWKAEGKAFGDKPAQGTLPNQMAVTGFKGKGLANSYVGGDGSTGTLTSPKFKIERDYINFLIGGGAFPDKTCVKPLLDGKMVRTATGPNEESGGSEELKPVHWSVKDLAGKEVVLQVVDQATGGWGHISVDHFVQSNTKVGSEGKVTPTKELSREIVLNKKNLLFPISNSAKPVRMTIEVDGKLIHNFDINLATDKSDWLAHLDVSAFTGKTAKITAKKVPEDSKGLSQIVGSDELTPKNVLPLYNKALRPQLRFSQLKGWNNDPNGMVYFDGEYHFFWQSNPFGTKWANMYWGHAVSKDLVHWEELPYALVPRIMAKEHCFSGSAHVDTKNTGGWGKDAMVIAFTDTGAGEALAVSTDRGRTWKAIAENPVVGKRKDEGRDPKLVWYEPGQHWVMVLFTKTKNKDYAEFYTSKNLKNWEKASSIEGYYECPEFFELAVDGDAKNKKWVLMAANAEYAIGSFDGKTFTPEHTGKHQVHHGAFYAAQCFSRSPGGRVIQVGWAQIETPGMPFNQAFSLPIELTLRTIKAGLRLHAEPIAELKTLRGDATSKSTTTISADNPLTLKSPGDLLDIVAEIEPGEAKDVLLTFGTNTLVYNIEKQTLDGMFLPQIDKKIKVRVVVDRPMYEVIGNNGAAYKTLARKDGGKAIESITISSIGGTATVKQIDVYPMKSIWKAK